MTVYVAAGAVADAYDGASNFAAAPLTFIYDLTAPTVELVEVSATHYSMIFRIVFSEVVVDFGPEHIVVDGCSLGSLRALQANRCALRSATVRGAASPPR